MRHLITIDDCDPDFLRAIIKRAQNLKEMRNGYFTHSRFAPLEDRLLCTMFYEPSTRTRLSFESAMIQLGGHVIGTENAALFSSAVKGESVADTFQVISGYCDIIVGRFKHQGDAQIAADASLVPVINGGDGLGEHPTQALIDLFSIIEKFPEPEDLHITFLGDNLHSRTVHSLARLLARYGCVKEMTFIGPRAQNFDADDATGFLHELTQGIAAPLGNQLGVLPIDSMNALAEQMIAESDIVYVTRPQIERHNGLYMPNMDEKSFVLASKLADKMPETSIIMHPLPRTWELPVEIDGNRRAYYFEQARNGIPVRMALLEGLCLFS